MQLRDEILHRLWLEKIIIVNELRVPKDYEINCIANLGLISSPKNKQKKERQKRRVSIEFICVVRILDIG